MKSYFTQPLVYFLPPVTTTTHQTGAKTVGVRATTPSIALIVEDEAWLAIELEELLIAEGFNPILASSWAEVVRVLPDSLAVAIVSITLADEIVGQRVMHSLRCIFPALPIVVVTGFDGAAPEADLRGLGGPTIRLRKPTERNAVASAIWDVIERARSGAKPAGGRRRADNG